MNYRSRSDGRSEFVFSPGNMLARALPREFCGGMFCVKISTMKSHKSDLGIRGRRRLIFSRDLCKWRRGEKSAPWIGFNFADFSLPWGEKPCNPRTLRCFLLFSQKIRIKIILALIRWKLPMLWKGERRKGRTLWMKIRKMQGFIWLQACSNERSFAFVF